jgi:predicted DNA-binding transcriptional regulator AlpA
MCRVGGQAMEDRLMKPKELAERLGTSMDWVYRHWKELPFTVKLSPRQLRFSEKGLEQYLKRILPVEEEHDVH